MKTKPKRCEDFYRILNRSFTDDMTTRKAFAQGWMSGLAEKVYMGACRAAMVSPLRIDAEWMIAAAEKIKDVYELYLFVHNRQFRTEIWFCRDIKTQGQLAAYINDNQFRATICGLDMALYNPHHVLEAPK